MGHHSHDKKHPERTTSSKKLAKKTITVNGVLLQENFINFPEINILPGDIVGIPIAKSCILSVNCAMNLLPTTIGGNVIVEIILSTPPIFGNSDPNEKVVSSTTADTRPGYLTPISLFWNGPVTKEDALFVRAFSQAADVNIVPGTFKFSSEQYSFPKN